jgi:uncharacterized repeat protein (TIGR04076 family)
LWRANVNNRRKTMSNQQERRKAPYRVEVTVIKQEGTCTFYHKVGDKVVFDGVGIQGPICWSALYSMIPKIHAMLYGAQFPWNKDPDIATHACPDAYNPVVFELRRYPSSRE